MESCFDSFRDSVSFSRRYVHMMVLVVEEAQVEARFGMFGYSANLDAR